MHVIAAKAVAFKEALDPSFKDYVHQVVKNAQSLALSLTELGVTIISGGTDSHLLLADLREFGITGHEASVALEKAHITCNKNSIPNDPLPPLKTSGIRLGTSACTTRGMDENDFKDIAHMIVDVMKGISMEKDTVIENTKHRVQKLLSRFPLYKDL